MFGLSRQTLLTLTILLGTSVSLVGCYLPWAYERTIPLVNTVPTSLIGVYYITMAAYAFPASVFTLFLTVIFVLKPRMYTRLPVLWGSLAILWFTYAWIVFPGMRLVEPKLGFEWPFNVYSILYGAYITLIGAIVASTASLLQLFTPLHSQTKNPAHL